MAGFSAIGLAAGGLTLLPVAASSAAGVSNVQVASQPALPQGAVALGAVSPGKAIAGDVALIPNDAAGLEAYATAVSEHGSPDYGHYLSLASFDEKFAPSASTITSVESDLRSGGLKVTSVTQDGLLVSFKGTAAKVDATFHTSIASYRLASGKVAFANDSAVELPSNIASSVQSVVGLNDLLTPRATPIAAMRTSAVPAKTGRHGSPPAGAANACSTVVSLAGEDGLLTANQVAYAYGLDPLYTADDFGAGQTVDILDLYGYSPSDVKAFDQCYYGTGETVSGNDTFTAVDNGATPGNGTGGSVETELDVETVNAYAPKAAVDVFEAPQTNPGFLDAVAAMTDDATSKVESISYGECEQEQTEFLPGYVEEENYLFEQAAAMGKTVFASSGDGGAEACTASTVGASDPAAQPFVTAVGGTAITAATDPPSEEVWNDGTAGGAGGGGISDVWPEPAWQSASTVPGINDPTVIADAETLNDDHFCADDPSYTVCREEPDVSAQASPNNGGFPIYADGEWTPVGGTSLSSPTWAAILADINSTSSCSAESGVGFVSPKLYGIASVPAEYKASFNDITAGNNDNTGAADGLFPSTTDYDMASGLGSPRVTDPGTGASSWGLAYYLCATPAVVPPTISTLSPTALSSSQVNGHASAQLTITGSGFFGSGAASDVAAVSIGSVTIPTADVTVNSGTSISVTVPKALFSEEIGNENGDGGGDGSGTYDVSVTLVGGATSAPGSTSRIILYDAIAAAATPVVAGTFPSAGVEAGGTAVTVYGSGFDPSGTPDVSSLTIGGLTVAPADWTVESDNTLKVTTPPESGADCLNGESPTTDVCQVEVLVTLDNSHASETTAIPPEYSGAVASETAAGTYAAANEFDYVPAPTISAITPDVASEGGYTEVTITGTGLGSLGLEWVDVGSFANSGDIDDSLVDVSPTSLTFDLPPWAPSTTPTSVPVWVQTYGSPNSAPGKTLGQTAPSTPTLGEDVTYAPTPAITSFSVSGTKYLAGPTSGGQKMTITGSGFDDAQDVSFTDLKYGFPTTQYHIDIVSNTEITLSTPAALTGVYELEVCGVSGCSSSPNLTYTYYVQGNPSLTSSTPATGKVGSTVTITGYNLGFTEAVYFGTVKATSFKQPAFWEDGNTSQLTAVVPAGAGGSKVDIQVETLEALATGYDGGKSPVNTSVTFTYPATVPSAPQDVSAKAGAATASVAWKAPKTNGGDPITGYVVTGTAKGEKSVSSTVAGTVLKASFSKLAAKVAWTFSVVARNKVGAGPSASAKPVTPT